MKITDVRTFLMNASEYDYQYIAAHRNRARWLEGSGKGWR